MQRRIVATAFLLAVPLLTPAADAQSSADPVLVAAPGGAQMRRSRFFPWRQAEPGRSLPADAELTCEGTCTVRSFDGNTIVLDPGSRVTIGPTTFVPMGDLTAAALGRRFELRDGSLTATVIADPKRPRTLVIGTSDDTMVAVRPGTSHIAVHEGRAGVACLQGGARVKQAHRTLDLKEGEAASLSPRARDESPLSARTLSPAPRWQEPLGKLDEPQPLGVALGSGGGEIGVSWQTVPGATAYRVELSSSPQFTKLASVDRVGPGQSSFIVHGLAEGAYFGRVIAFDADGLASRPSPTTPLRVIGLELPPGAVTNPERSTLVMPAGTTLRLRDIENLEMAVDDHKFVPATLEWTVDDAPHIVRLRRRSDFGHESRFRIEPRALRADVHLGSAWARWPDDPVDISVTLVDPSGHCDPTTVKPDVQVLIGVEPVAVDWTQAGATVTARLAPRAISGPEVIRVIVRDEHGGALGRNFLEVEPSAASTRTRLARR